MSQIIGIGMDATDIGRIAAVIEKYGDRFLQRVFTSGELAYCNAGHDNPTAVLEGRGPLRLEGGDGPGLCVLDDFAYRGAAHALQPGETVCVVTDGVIEADDGTGRRSSAARPRRARLGW